MQFLNETHERHFNHFLQQAYFEEDVTALKEKLKPLLRKQLAFLYMIAYFQDDYKVHEGDCFYIEDYDGMEIGGPTYLFEEAVTLRIDYPHERVIYYAKKLLINEIEEIEEVSGHPVIQTLYTQAKAFCQ